MHGNIECPINVQSALFLSGTGAPHVPDAVQPVPPTMVVRPEKRKASTGEDAADQSAKSKRVLPPVKQEPA